MKATPKPIPAQAFLPNPYQALDAEGFLAGACPVAEELRPGTALPLRRYVGAKLHVIDGTYEKRNPGQGQQSRCKYRWEFKTEPVSIAITSPSIAVFYRARTRTGEVIALPEGGDTSAAMVQLAKARAKAIADFHASYGEDPPTELWAEQFALDAEVAKVALPKAEPAAPAAAPAAASKTKPTSKEQ